ncbi:MAG: flippase-like domain-containing protein [Caldilineaceae bacterium]|nr:flippase-like domain-containing protein [Caldilineaceae bacterium]
MTTRKAAAGWRRWINWQLLILLGAVLLLWYAVRTVSWPETLAVLNQVGWGQLAILVALNLGVLLTITARWWVLLLAQGYNLPIVDMLAYRMTVFGVSYFTPGPQFGGEVFQVVLVSRRHAVPVAASVAATTMDKIAELLPNFLFLFVGAMIAIQAQYAPSAFISNTLAITAGSVFALGLLLVLLWRGYHPVAGLVRLVLDAWPANRQRHAGVQPEHRAVGAAFYRLVYRSEEQVTWLCRERPVHLLVSLVASALSWVLMFAEFWYVAAALGMPLTFVMTVTALVVVRLAFLLPAPAGIGALEAGVVLVMAGYGYSATAAVSLVLLMRMRDVLQGLIGLWAGGLDVLLRRRVVD